MITLNKIDWQPNETMPKDNTIILRWHLIWNIPIAIKYAPEAKCLDKNGELLPWVEATYTTAWPEIAFSEQWAEIPKGPVNENAS